ncbi:peptidase [Sulfuricaulis limicola]|uniref:Peptidase n=2 Tax=Sulfuricaulis limicola TaxID=1620215 RepID=A0A1B4XJF2_9GAMM|nr:peptidase [Sulfuricaulis limicola]
MFATLGAARAEPAPDAALAEALRASLAAPVVSCSESRLDPRRLAPFYQPDSPRPHWVSYRGPGARARLLRALLRTAGQHGLEPARYRIDDIEAHWRDRSPAGQACLELYLTSAFERYSLDLRTGRVGPHEADPSWYLPVADFDPAAALAAVGNDGDFAALIDSLAPSHPAYERLREALARYESIAHAGGWPALSPGPEFGPGKAPAAPEQIALLRERLRAEGDLSGFSFGNHEAYDAPLEAAVKRFQQRHGLQADGVVGARTRAALNVPVAARIAQLRRTLERWRWMPRDFGEHYILVNSAGFELAVVERGRTVLGMRVIVGMPEQPTPSFAASLQTLAINPYWNVPERIAREVLLPKQQRDPLFFTTRGIRVFDASNGNGYSEEIEPGQLDWISMDAESFDYRLRQEPGPKNSLGRLSFMLPNPFGVFLHDTPDKALFERDTRTFSESCVRLEQAMALAQHALRRLDGWDEERLRNEIDTQNQQTLRLPEPIPVYVLYLTSWVDDDGLVHFREDVYQRERILAGYYPAK